MRVLLCDDDASVREFLGAMFEIEGWDVECVESGEQCLQVLEASQQPDVLVIDQAMPGLQGTQVADHLRDNGFRRPIVLCSGNLRSVRRAEVQRLDLLTVNKVDVPAVVRLAHAAVVEHERTERVAAPRRRQQWPV